ncbi:hypothetical protein IIA79_06010 [bacterium]|nr:hypothetical protein [bacterium]
MYSDISNRIVKGGRLSKGERVLLQAHLFEEHPFDKATAAAAPQAYGNGGRGAGARGFSLVDLAANGGARRLAGEVAHRAQPTVPVDTANERLLAKVKAQVGRLKDQSERELRAMRKQEERKLEEKRESIKQEIRAELEKEMCARFQDALSALEGAAADLRQRQEQYLGAIEEPALRLVMAVARQLISAELRQSPSVVAHSIAQAFNLLKPRQVASAAVHPQTLCLLREDNMLASSLAQAGINPDLVELIADDSLKPDQFSVRLNGSSVDFDLDSAIEEMTKHLLGRAAGIEDDERTGRVGAENGEPVLSNGEPGAGNGR